MTPTEPTISLTINVTLSLSTIQGFLNMPGQLTTIVNQNNLILQGIALTQKEITDIMADLSALEAQVKTETDIDAAAVKLITGLAAQITAAGTDPTKLKALTDQMATNSASLAAAVAANTTAAPTTTPTTPPTPAPGGPPAPPAPPAV